MIVMRVIVDVIDLPDFVEFEYGRVEHHEHNVSEFWFSKPWHKLVETFEGGRSTFEIRVRR